MSNIDWSKKITPAMRAVEHAETVRAQRDVELVNSGWLVERHRDEMEYHTATTLTAEQYTELQTYRQRLRDWPAQPGLPDINRPLPPDWLAELTT